MKTKINHFEDWTNKVVNNTNHRLTNLLEFKEHYQNLLSYEENLKNFREYFGKLN